MKIEINHVEVERGVFKKTIYYGVNCNVSFSVEELQIIETNKLDSVVVLERIQPADIKDDLPAKVWFLRVGALTAKTSGEYLCSTKREARIYQQNLVKALEDLKQFIVDNREIEEENMSFEL